MRFDDSLKTVLAADASTDFGARAAFRQLADLTARGRIAPTDDILDRLRTLRDLVPGDVRAATARGLALAHPPAALVGVFAEDVPDVAGPLLRSTSLDAEEWIALLPRIGPVGRAVLRRRRDLPAAVGRALESFGTTDFSLGYDAPARPLAPAMPVDRPAAPPVGAGPFSAVGAVAEALPIVAEARRRVAESAPVTQPPRYEIADLVDRIAAFQRDRESVRAAPDIAPPPTGFRFESDVHGVIRWIDARPRGAVIGISLAHADGAGAAQVDGVATGAFRRRTAFANARLRVTGVSALAGDWRISGVPLFDQATGRFTGFRGGARRPRADESAAPAGDVAGIEGLRRLVHELRTPTNAISGFSELIESELLGPVAAVYRERASTIRSQAAGLVAAIEDLDMAARIDGDALELRPGELPIAPLLARLIGELAPLTRLRGCTMTLDSGDATLAAASDDRATERLLSRLLATLVSAGQPGEEIVSAVARDASGAIGITITRPRALAAIADTALLSLDAEREADLPGAPLLGTGFSLRLARNLASELGGSLVLGMHCLTLRLPAASIGDMGQASTI